MPTPTPRTGKAKPNRDRECVIPEPQPVWETIELLKARAREAVQLPNKRNPKNPNRQQQPKPERDEAAHNRARIETDKQENRARTVVADPPEGNLEHSPGALAAGPPDPDGPRLPAEQPVSGLRQADKRVGEPNERHKAVRALEQFPL